MASDYDWKPDLRTARHAAAVSRARRFQPEAGSWAGASSEGYCSRLGQQPEERILDSVRPDSARCNLFVFVVWFSTERGDGKVAEIRVIYLHVPVDLPSVPAAEQGSYVFMYVQACCSVVGRN